MENNKELIGKFVTRVLWTDADIVGEIVGTFGKTGILIKRMKATKNSAKMEFIAGGFSAHCVNNWNQDWEFEYSENTDLIKLRLGKSFKKRFTITEKPYNFYDYNF